MGEWKRRHWRGVGVSDLVEEVEGGGRDGSVGSSKVKLLLSEGGCRVGGSLFGVLDLPQGPLWALCENLSKIGVIFP